MRKEKLKKIKASIRKNWGQIAPFKQIPRQSFNCYMFAICNTEPTEVFINNKFLTTTGEKILYFGSIGKISGTNYKTLAEYKQAFINDLNVMGISAEECFADFSTTEDTDSITIAFYSNFEEGMSKMKEEFHFLRFIPSENIWMGKEGYPGGFQTINAQWSIDQIKVTNQKRIGIFKLTLIDKGEG